MLSSRLIPVLRPFIEVTPPEEEDEILSFGVCKTSTSSDHTITLTPAVDIPGIQEGDYLVVWLYCGTATAQKYSFTPLVGWVVLEGRTQRAESSQANFICQGKFYSALDTSYTWNHERVANTTICLQAFAYRGISKRYPVDQNQGMLTAGNNSSLFLPDHKILWGRRRRIHGATAIVAQAHTYRSSTTGASLSLSEDMYIGGNTLDIGSYGFASNMHLDCVHERVISSGLENLLPDQAMIGGEIGPGGMYVQSLLFESLTDTNLASIVIRVVGASVIAEHYLYKSVSMQAGQQGFILARLGGVTTVSTDHRWVVSVRRPDGTMIGKSFSTDQSGRGVTDSLSMNDPDFWFGMSAYYSGLPSYKSFLAGIAFTAETTGTYEIRLYPIREDKTALAYNPGPNDSYRTNLGFYGCAFAIGRMPDMIATDNLGGTGLNDGNLVPVAAWKYGDADRNYYEEVYISGFVLNKSTASFQAPVMIPVYPDTVQPVMEGAVGLSGSIQPFRHGEVTGLHLMSDRVLLPYYKLAEDGAEIQGRYYWEVEVGSSHTQHNRIGLCVESGMTMFYDDLVTLYGPGIVIRADSAIFNGNTQVATGSWDTGTIFGIAFDIVGNYVAIYRNGTLLWDGQLASTVGIDKACYRVFCGLADPGGDTSFIVCKIKFNFTGPFAYAKPSGYAAFDPFNEVS